MLCPNCINQKYGELFYKSLTQCDDENRKINSYYFLIMGNMYVVMSKLKDRISTDNKHMIKYIMRKNYLVPKILWASTTTVDSRATQV